jgi:hypothetical protein
MQRTMNRSGFLAHIFHDVDFAALGPAICGDVGAEHPKSGPHSLACGDFDARFESSVSLAEEALSPQAGGSVIVRSAAAARIGRLVHRSYDQIAALQLSVLRQIGVALEFIVAPALAAGVVRPFGGIRGRTIGAAEFVAPDKLVTRRGRRLKGRAAATTER